ARRSEQRYPHTQAQGAQWACSRRHVARRSSMGGTLPPRGCRPSISHECTIDGRQLLGRNVQSLDEMTAVAREGVALGHVGTRLRAYLDDVLPALPAAALIRHAALGRYHAVRAGREAALRVAVVEHELCG